MAIIKSKWRLYVVNCLNEITVKTAQNFHFRTKNSLKWMILEEGSPIKLHIESYYLHCNFSKFCSIVAHRRSNVNFWWPWPVLTCHWRPCNRQFLALQFAPRLHGSLFLSLIFVYLGPVKGISHTKSVKCICLSNQQSDIEFEQPVDK